MTNWRDSARPIIAEVIARVGRDDMKALRRALREAYPFGPRQYYPYRIWLDEIKEQLGLKPHKKRDACEAPTHHESLPGQLTLFED
jgi:hypothetical protein